MRADDPNVTPRDRWVLYGAYGFTGRLILQQALALGLRPVIAGRSADNAAQLARVHGLESFAAHASDPDALTGMLGGAVLVLNAAGPFGETAVPLMHACLRTGTHYVDIGGDISVLKQQLALARAFEGRNIAAVLAVGFDVVPTDYAAKWVAFEDGKAVEGADEIRLGLSLPLSMSRGSAKAYIDEVEHGTLIATNGVLVRVRALSHTWAFDYGTGPSVSLATTWGDLLTSPLTTGIRNVSVYFEATREVRQAARLSELIAVPARWAWGRALLKSVVRFQAEGPDERLRTTQHATIVAQLLGHGKVMRTIRIRTGDPYEFTGASAAKAVRRLLDDRDLAGIRTPASVLGDDFLNGLPGVVVEAAARV